MTQREMNRMDEQDRVDALRSAASDLERKLNLYGDETVEKLIAAVEDGTEQAVVGQMLSPDCNCAKRNRDECENRGHGFPRWFCEEARPVANRFLRMAGQYRKARGEE